MKAQMLSLVQMFLLASYREAAALVTATGYQSYAVLAQ